MRRRLALLIAAFGLTSCRATPARLASIPVGDSVRVTVANSTRLVGTLVARPDSVIRYDTRGTVLATPLALVRSVEVRDHRAKRGLVRGAIYGAVVASGAWAFRARSLCEPDSCAGAQWRAALRALPIGLTYGAVSGVVVGAHHVGWSRRWP